MSRPSGSVFPYSKVCNLAADTLQLTSYMAAIDQVPIVMVDQNPIRKWEYAMALRAIHGWRNDHAPDGPLHVCDVGGAQSGFWQVLAPLSPDKYIVIVDPAAPHGHVNAVPGAKHIIYPCGIEEYATPVPERRNSFDVLTVISVIEHVEQVKHFFRACHTILRPGGLLFFTADYWDAEGPDTAHFHWMRQRIYNDSRIKKLLADLRDLGFQSFGHADWSYHGNQVYDYSIVGVAMVKK